MSQDPNQTPNLDAIYDSIESAESPGGYLPRLGIGTHTVLVDAFRGKNSKQGYGTILEADFVVVSSTVHQPGERRGWPFMPQATGFRGTYEKDRVKQLYVAADQGAGIAPRATKETGAAMTSGALRGVLVQVLVEPAFDKVDATKPLRDKKGRPIGNASFNAVQQTADEIRANLAKMPVTRQAPAPQAQAPQYAQAPAPQYPPQGYPQAPAPQYPPQGYPQGYAPPAQPQYPPQGYPQPGYAPAPAAAPQGQPAGQQPPPSSFLAGLRGNGNG